ncbi:hypothetical protein BJP34_18860 [Moorena producens PAL-8-15-08-1]|uniref:Uncharacterized protein n=1 Tax=Moorena producens PAL-8-15-08-1 TaxID=1458985 RepID=A0A1D8TUK0_9CYAN|nr:hypothetical protein [Moorena producens]AOX01225.1 hypothetical protein BJP34_18860 [Moorena producens PAL-8-15-08-1]
MTDSALRLKNPSVTLYAFHLCQDLSQELEQLRPDADRLWQHCANLSQPLGIPDLKSLPEKIKSSPSQTAIASHYLELLPGNAPLTYTAPVQLAGSALIVQVYPVKIHDTYALDLTLSCQNTIAASQFSHFNPQGCLLASTIQASLGQTLVLYGEPVGTPEDDRTLANACVDGFFQGTDQKPEFMASGQLFGSPIFAYDNGKEKPTEQCHLLVWLNRNPETLKLVEKTSLSFFHLLCCRSKILFAYHEARWCYRQTRALYGQLEQEVKGFKELATKGETGITERAPGGEQNSQSPPKLGDLGGLTKTKRSPIDTSIQQRPETRLEQLKQKLTEMPSKTFDYAGYLRDMEDHKNAIATNAHNYDYWLEKIREHSLEDDSIKFLEDFLNQRTKRFEKQIQTDLNYLKPGQQLFDQMLGSIRGIVDIEQAECDRALEKALRDKEKADQAREKQLESIRHQEQKAAEKREKNLERWITLVGTGLAVSGISSQTDAKPIESVIAQLYSKESLDFPTAGVTPWLTYSVVFVLVHVGVGLIAAFIMDRFLKLVSK